MVAVAAAPATILVDSSGAAATAAMAVAVWSSSAAGTFPVERVSSSADGFDTCRNGGLRIDAGGLYVL